MIKKSCKTIMFFSVLLLQTQNIVTKERKGVLSDDEKAVVKAEEDITHLIARAVVTSLKAQENSDEEMDEYTQQEEDLLIAAIEAAIEAEIEAEMAEGDEDFFE